MFKCRFYKFYYTFNILIEYHHHKTQVYNYTNLRVSIYYSEWDHYRLNTYLVFKYMIHILYGILQIIKYFTLTFTISILIKSLNAWTFMKNREINPFLINITTGAIIIRIFTSLTYYRAF